MLELDTNALDQVLRMLGRGTPSTVTQFTEFQDELLQQTLDVGRSVRRSRAFPGQTGGSSLLRLAFANVGAATGSIVLDPYNATFVNGGPPLRELRDLDCWVCGATAVVPTGSGFFTDALLFIDGIPSINGAATSRFHILAAWDSVVATLAGAIPGETGSGLLTPRIQPIRVPRGANLTLSMRTTGAASIIANLIVFYGPAGLGQDAVGEG